MSIILYDETRPHPGGFSGYRVNGNGKQRYFSIERYGDEAHALAEKLDADWRRASQRRKKNKTRVLIDSGHPDKPHIIAPGLRAYVNVHQKFREFEYRRYFGPVFLVSFPKQSGISKTFAVRKDYAGAWLRAVDFYCKQRRLRQRTRSALLLRMPPPEVFRDIMAELAPQYADEYGWPFLEAAVRELCAK